MIKLANWIRHPDNALTACPIFRKKLTAKAEIVNAVLEISAYGVYNAYIDGKRVGNFILAPGWTAYQKRLQYQVYDVTDMITKDSILTVSVGTGWAVGRIAWMRRPELHGLYKPSLIAALRLTYADGSEETICTDASWQCAASEILMSEIYDGETVDSRITDYNYVNAEITDAITKNILVPQDGAAIIEHETLTPVDFIITPKGEKVIDFGQNLTGYPAFTVTGKPGDQVELSFAEVLDKDGNFYTTNYRSSQEKVIFICNGTQQTYKPHHSFMGFRYLRVDSYPTELTSLDDVKNFAAIVVYSDLKRTGYFSCSDPLVNKLYENTIWGQKGNYLDVPTDCPQRDERLGWTGDTEVFVRTGSYHYDVRIFFRKWLRDLAAEQYESGAVPHVIPHVLGGHERASAAWADAATICPWELYRTYGDLDALREQFPAMQKWVDYMHHAGSEEYLWLDGTHFGDWLGLDAPEGSYTGSTEKDLIASAYFAYSTSILIKAGNALGIDVSAYKTMYPKIVSAFRERFMDGGNMKCNTQTANALALHFGLTPKPAVTAAELARLVRANGNKLQTGFVGTPYLLHALTDNGYADLAYALLLQQDYPSWLYAVNKGATTIWEHWDGLKPDGSMWSEDMNSFNHYAYGAVADWMYGDICGIKTDETAPGFAHIIFAPLTHEHLTWAEASIDTIRGTVKSRWERTNGITTYTFTVPESATATIKLGGLNFNVGAGVHTYKF